MSYKALKWFFVLIILIEANTSLGNPLEKNPTAKRNPFASLLPPKSSEPSLSAQAESFPWEKKEQIVQNSPTPKPTPVLPKSPKKQTSPNKKIAIILTGTVIVGKERFAVIQIQGTHHIVLEGEIFLGREVLEIQKDRMILLENNQQHVLKIQKEE